MLAFVGFLAVVLLGISLAFAGPFMLFFVHAWGGFSSKREWVVATTMFVLGGVLIFYGFNHAPFSIEFHG